MLKIKIQTMNNYIVHTQIKCADGKIRRLSYDLIEQTEGSVKEFGRVFREMEKRFPDVQFWIQRYPEDGKILWIFDDDVDAQLIHKPVKNTDNEV